MSGLRRLYCRLNTASRLTSRRALHAAAAGRARATAAPLSQRLRRGRHIFSLRGLGRRLRLGQRGRQVARDGAPLRRGRVQQVRHLRRRLPAPCHGGPQSRAGSGRQGALGLRDPAGQSSLIQHGTRAPESRLTGSPPACPAGAGAAGGAGKQAQRQSAGLARLGRGRPAGGAGARQLAALRLQPADEALEGGAQLRIEGHVRPQRLRRAACRGPPAQLSAQLRAVRAWLHA